MRLHTCATLTKDAMSMTANSVNICMIISSGSPAMGHGGVISPSMMGVAGAIERPENPAMSCFIDCGGPSREWWARLGTVTDAFDGFGFIGFEEKEDGGKCLFLYFWSTRWSN